MDIVKLRELLEEELSSLELANIGEEFYPEFDSLIKALRMGAEGSHERGDDVEERLYLAQLNIAESIAREIVRIRLHKIVDLAFEGLPTELTAEERRILSILKAFIERRDIPSPGETPEGQEIEEAPKPKLEATKVPRVAYIVKVDLPRVLDEGLNEYGPFRAGDLAVIPESIGKVLIERDAAERVKISP